MRVKKIIEDRYASKRMTESNKEQTVQLDRLFQVHFIISGLGIQMSAICRELLWNNLLAVQKILDSGKTFNTNRSSVRPYFLFV